MKFFDEVTIKVKSWAWWNGIISWRREKHVPFGWPSGGNGWNWWSVVLQWTTNERTLMQYRYNVIYKADPGENWWSKEQYWKDAEDIILKVPLWTIVKHTKTWSIIWHITTEGEMLVLANWWKWWVWNMHFVTPQVQYPEIALYGEPWITKEITLELQLLADVALVWMPSVWKSSLINVVSNVKAKTAEYHFTTLIPNLWVVDHKKKSFILIDIPWLIEWASDWKWLWSDFLRHILKSRALSFMIDASKFESWWKDFWILFNELKNYLLERYEDSDIQLTLIDKKIYLEVKTKWWDVILRKAVYWIINKVDILWDTEIVQEVMDWWKLYCHNETWISKKDIIENTYWLSAATREWVDNRLNQMITTVDNELIISKFEFEKVEILHKIDISIKDITELEKEDLQAWGYLPADVDWSKIKVREVVHPQVGYLSYVVPWWNDQAELRYWRQLEKQWHLEWMWTVWAKKWHILKVISLYEGVNDKYILWE